MIASFVRNRELGRALLNAQGRNEKQNFWRVLQGSAFDIAVIEWCKLFGSDDEDHQPVHWKNIVPKDAHDCFRSDLHSTTVGSKEKWESYWADVKAYRDRHAAHFDDEYLRRENDPRYPDLSTAFDAAVFYYNWIIKRMNDADTYPQFPPDLRRYSDEFLQQSEAMAEAAFKATASMDEAVK